MELFGGEEPSAQRTRKRETERLHRLEQHKKNEAQRPEDRRLLTRTDLNDRARKILSAATEYQYGMTARLFLEFMEDVLEKPPGFGKQYFKTDGPLPDLKTLRQFLLYISDVGKGMGGGKVTRRTAVSHTMNIIGALGVTNRPLDREVIGQLLKWVNNNLSNELELNKDLAVSKPIAHRADVSTIIRTMYSPLGLRQVPSMRLLLNVSIFINLMVDVCGRIHEITSTERYPDQYLRYRHLRVFCFRNKQNDQIEGLDHKDGQSKIRVVALLKVGGLKGHKDDPGKYKEIPLRLLPSHLCFEDSLRLILHAALIDGHIVGAQNWNDLEKIMSQCESEDGRLLQFHESSMDMPLICAVDHHTSTVLKDKPAKPDIIPIQLRRIGRLCGFKDILKSHAFRRGAGYTLEATGNDRLLRWALGHSPDSKTYEKYYASNTSTTDIQGLMHGVTPIDVVSMSGMSLSRVPDVPKRLSAAGGEKVLSSPELVDHTRQIEEAMDIIIDKYGSIAQAERADCVEYRTYKKYRDAYKVRLRVLRTQEFKKEYEANVKNGQTLQLPEDICGDPKDNIGDLVEFEDDPDNPSFVSDENDEYEISDSPQNLNTENIMQIMNGKEQDAEDIADANIQPDSAPGLDIEPLDMQTIPKASTSLDGNQTTRLHGIYSSHIKERHAEGHQFETAALRSHRFDTLFEDATSQQLSDSDVSDLWMPFFRTTHALERYGNLAPEPGTFICPTCYEDQSSKDSFEDHVYNCRRDTAEEFARMDWDRVIRARMSEPCTWRMRNAVNCDKVFESPSTYVEHLIQHTRKRSRAVYCCFRSCLDQEFSEYVELSTPDDWADHLSEFHETSCYRSSKSFVYFCAFCDDHISHGVTGPAARARHFTTHLNEALDSIAMHGYTPVHSTYRGGPTLSVRHPGFCPFCVHNMSLGVEERLSVINRQPGNEPQKTARKHLQMHFDEIGDLDSPCPALCSSKATFSATQLRDHLLYEHGISAVGKVAVTSMPPKKKARKITN